jgi:hypothetical protein
VNKRYAELHARLRDVMAETLAHGAQQSGEAYTFEPQDGARVLLAFGTGAVLERAADGDAFSDELIERAIAALGPGVLATPPAAISAFPARRRMKA